MIGIDIRRVKEREFRRFIKEFPDHADTIANAVADAFARHAQGVVRGKGWPKEAAPSIGAWRSSRGDHPYIVRPGRGVSGRLNFLLVFERPDTGWPHRPAMGPAVNSFDASTPAIDTYNRIVRKRFG